MHNTALESAKAQLAQKMKLMMLQWSCDRPRKLAVIIENGFRMVWVRCQEEALSTVICLLLYITVRAGSGKRGDSWTVGMGVGYVGRKRQHKRESPYTRFVVLLERFIDHKWPSFCWLDCCQCCRLSTVQYSWFQTFTMLWMLYAFFWVIPRRLNFICWCFRTPCLFSLHRQVGMKNKNYSSYLPA
jgi:hypothetical protein